MPTLVGATELARRLNISRQRVYQLRDQGILTPEAGNKFDLEKAMQTRRVQAMEHESRMLTTEHSNGHSVSEAKYTLISDDELLGLEPSAPPPTPATTPIGRQERLAELRAQKLEAEIERAKQRSAIEAGEYVRRDEVRTQAFEAGKVIASILRALPSEIASVFADPERKEAVFSAVQTRVDQMQSALHSALQGQANDDY